MIERRPDSRCIDVVKGDVNIGHDGDEHDHAERGGVAGRRASELGPAIAYCHRGLGTVLLQASEHGRVSPAWTIDHARYPGCIGRFRRAAVSLNVLVCHNARAGC